ncbi:MAG: hypothetical protein ACYC2H_01250 [Thermoplasmatota archaeon]
MTKTIITFFAFVLFVLTATGAAFAQKPVGLFDPGSNPPSWASFGTISDTASDAALATAHHLCSTRGFLYVLQVGYHENPVTPIGPHAEAVRARMVAAGLQSCFAAITVGEEWYEHFRQGSFTRFGFPPETPNGITIIRDWMGAQHAAAKAVFGLPVMWITTAATHYSSSWQPIPLNVDFVAIDSYPNADSDFSLTVAPVLALAEQSTTLPLVLIPRWFVVDGELEWSPEASETMVANYKLWFDRPRWVAMMGFTWQDRPTLGMRGLKGLPTLLAAVERSLGVR